MFPIVTINFGESQLIGVFVNIIHRSIRYSKIVTVDEIILDKTISSNLIWHLKPICSVSEIGK